LAAKPEAVVVRVVWTVLATVVETVLPCASVVTVGTLVLTLVTMVLTEPEADWEPAPDEDE